MPENSGDDLQAFLSRANDRLDELINRIEAQVAHVTEQVAQVARQDEVLLEQGQALHELVYAMFLNHLDPDTFPFDIVEEEGTEGESGELGE